MGKYKITMNQKNNANIILRILAHFRVKDSYIPQQAHHLPDVNISGWHRDDLNIAVVRGWRVGSRHVEHHGVSELASTQRLHLGGYRNSHFDSFSWRENNVQTFTTSL